MRSLPPEARDHRPRIRSVAWSTRLRHVVPTAIPTARSRPTITEHDRAHLKAHGRRRNSGFAVQLQPGNSRYRARNRPRPPPINHAMFPAARIGDPVTHDLTAPSGVIGPPVAPSTAG